MITRLAQHYVGTDKKILAKEYGGPIQASLHHHDCFGPNANASSFFMGEGSTRI